MPFLRKSGEKWMCLPPPIFLPYLQAKFRVSELLGNCWDIRRKGAHLDVNHPPIKKYHLDFMCSRNRCLLYKVITNFVFVVVTAASANLTDACAILGKSSKSLVSKEI